MEFGIHESLGTYSGGLGVLSGDHCKAASDLGVPLVGVGLLYRSGYFRQTVDADGFQQHIYPNYDFARLPILPVQAPNGGVLTVPIDLPGRVVQAAVWKAQVGRVPVLMLDTDIPLNDPADRPITGVLYVRGREMRLCQGARLRDRQLPARSPAEGMKRSQPRSHQIGRGCLTRSNSASASPRVRYAWTAETRLMSMIATPTTVRRIWRSVRRTPGMSRERRLPLGQGAVFVRSIPLVDGLITPQPRQASVLLTATV